MLNECSNTSHPIQAGTHSVAGSTFFTDPPLTRSMSSDHLDDVDATILHHLQTDARNTSAADIAEDVDVTPNTVRNRIGRLEDQGIIDTYVPMIEYERAGYPLQVVIACTAPIPERPALASEAMTIDGVTHVREMMTGSRNVRVTAVAAEGEWITEIASELHELGLEIEEEQLVKNDYLQPFNHFASGPIEE